MLTYKLCVTLGCAKQYEQVSLIQANVLPYTGWFEGGGVLAGQQALATKQPLLLWSLELIAIIYCYH